MAFPKPSPELSALLEALAEADDRLERRKMFGSSAVFLTQNRQMLAGVFGEQFHVRLSEADREAVRALGGHPLEPMEGRPMREYMTLPADVVADESSAREWLHRGIAFVQTLPEKKKKKAPKKKKGSTP